MHWSAQLGQRARAGAGWEGGNALVGHLPEQRELQALEKPQAQARRRWPSQKPKPVGRAFVQCDEELLHRPRVRVECPPVCDIGWR